MIAKKMQIPQPAVSRTLRSLENGGYLQREVCRSDRRNTYVSLTDAGKAAVQEADQTLATFHEGIQKRFTKEEAEQLMALLQRLYAAAAEQLARNEGRSTETRWENSLKTSNHTGNPC